MVTALGYLLIVVGLSMIILPVLAWLGWITPRGPTLAPAGPWDAVVELVRKAPWMAGVGLVLIYLGLKVLGVPLPP